MMVKRWTPLAASKTSYEFEISMQHPVMPSRSDVRCLIEKLFTFARMPAVVWSIRGTASCPILGIAIGKPLTTTTATASAIA